MAAELNRRGISVSVDNLGENVTNVEEARASAQLYHQLLDQMAANKLNANAPSAAKRLTGIAFTSGP